MCVKYYTSKEITDQRKRLKEFLDRKVKRDSIDDFDFLAELELEILGEIDLYNQEIQDILQQYYKEEREYDWLYLALAGVLRAIYLSVGINVGKAYYDKFELTQPSYFDNLLLPYISQRTTQVLPGIISNLPGEFSKEIPLRSLVVASTEVRVAGSVGEYLAMKNINFQKPVRKYWIGVLDDRIRQDHFDATQQYNKINSVDFNSLFLVGGEWLLYPRDTSGSAKNIINCRCYLGYIET